MVRHESGTIHARNNYGLSNTVIELSYSLEGTIMSNTWVVVADRKRARIFRAESLIAPLHEVKDLISAADAEPPYSDKPGRSFNRGGHHRHALTKEKTGPKVELERFAKTIAEAVDIERVGLGMSELILVAAPELLGMLRSHLGRPTAHLVTHELRKDIVHLSIPEIQKHLGTC